MRRDWFLFLPCLFLLAFGFYRSKGNLPFLSPSRGFTELAKNQSLPARGTFASTLLRASGGELFAALFPAGAGKSSKKVRWNEAEFVRTAELRFAEKYPVDHPVHHSGGREQEVIARLGILKAMGRHFSGIPARKFYRRVAMSAENVLVRRQALENLRPFLAGEAELAHGELVRNLPPLVIALGSSTEAEILEGFWRGDGQRQLSQTTERVSLNRWENLPCPSAAEFSRLAQAVGWKGTEPYSCDLTPLGKLGRALFLLSGLELSFNEAAGEVGANLRHPFEYLAQRSGHLVFNFDQTTSVARNRVGAREIQLGGLFFTIPPLEALGVLVHEARHSDAGEDPSHQTCVQGDIPRSPGGCDEELTNARNAGAYSYDVFFALALARHSSLAESDREYLRSSALQEMANRFNRLFPQLAHFQDAITGLNEDGQIVFLHPFAQKTVNPLGIESAERFDRIAYDDRFGQVLLFGNGPARTWAWGYYPGAYASEAQNFHVGYAARARIPYDDFAYSIFWDAEKGLRYLGFDPATGSTEAMAYPLTPDFSVDSFFLSLDHTYFLSADGWIHRQRGGAQEAEDFSRIYEGEFKQGTGGVLKDSLYLVAGDGVLYREETREVTSWLWWKETVRELHPADFQVPVPAVRYEEGTAFRALLDEEGNLWLNYYGDQATKVRISGFKLKSFIFTRLLETAGPVRVERKARESAEFRQRCGVRETAVDPWFLRGVGIAQGKLIFEGDDAECLEAALPAGVQGKVAGFAFSAGALTNQSGDPRDNFAPVALVITLQDGSTVSVRPYEGWGAVAP